MTQCIQTNYLTANVCLVTIKATWRNSRPLIHGGAIRMQKEETAKRKSVEFLERIAIAALEHGMLDLADGLMDYIKRREG